MKRYLPLLAMLALLLPLFALADEPESLPFQETTSAPSIPFRVPVGGTFIYASSRYLVDGGWSVRDLYITDGRDLAAQGYIYPSLSKAEDLHKLPKLGQSAESFFLPLPSVMRENSLLLGGSPATFTVDGLLQLPSTRKLAGK